MRDGYRLVAIGVRGVGGGECCVFAFCYRLIDGFGYETFVYVWVVLDTDFQSGIVW